MNEVNDEAIDEAVNEIINNIKETITKGLDFYNGKLLAEFVWESTGSKKKKITIEKIPDERKFAFNYGAGYVSS